MGYQGVTKLIEGLEEVRLRRFQPYPEYNDSGVEWLGKIPVGWEVTRLRATVTGCHNGVWGDESDEVHDLICVRVADFDRVQFRVRLDAPTTRSIDPRLAQIHRLEAKNLLIEKSGGGDKQPVGAVVMYDHGEPAVCSNFVARMPVAGGCDSRYVTYLHAALYAVRINTRSIKRSTGIQNLDSASYLNEPVGLPREMEQRAIADFLDHETAKIDALVAKKERLIELLQKKRTALITRAVTRGLDLNVAMKDSGVEWVGEIPAHWGVIPLGRLIRRIEQGWSPVAEDRPAGQDEWGVIKLSAVSRGIFRQDEHKALPFGLRPDPRLVIRQDDFLLTRSNTPELVGDVCVVGAVRNHLMLCDLVYRLIMVHTGVDPSFLVYWFLSPIGRHQIEVEARGSSQSMVKVSRGIIRAWSVVMPPPTAQRAIAAFLDRETAKIDALIGKVRQANRHFKEFRTALISAAVTGKIDVRDASGQAAAAQGAPP